MFDTNVVLDVLLAREPHRAAAARLMDAVVRGRLGGLVCATMLATALYVVRRQVGAAKAHYAVAELLATFEVAPVDGHILALASASTFGDFEDAVLHEAAVAAGADCIVTRDLADVGGARIPVHAPERLVAILAPELGAHDE